MVGGRAEVVGPVANKFVEVLANVSIFADVTERIVVGTETNLNQGVGGNTSVLVMPQVHYKLGHTWMIEGGVGARSTTGFILPEAGFRFSRQFSL